MGLAKLSGWAIAVAAAIAIASSAHASTYYWYGNDSSLGGDGTWSGSASTDGQWGTATTGVTQNYWNGSTADSAVIQGDGGTIDVVGNMSLGTLSITSITSAVNVTGSAGTLTLNGAGTSWGTVLNLSAATQDVTISAYLNRTGGGWKYLTLAAGRTLTLSGGCSLGSSTALCGADTTSVYNLSGAVSASNQLYVQNATVQYSGTGLNTRGIQFGTSNASTYNSVWKINAGDITTPNTSTATTSADIYFVGGTGTLNLNGGTITTLGIHESVSGLAAWSSVATSTVNFNGGTLRANANNSSTFLKYVDNVYVKEGGAIIDTQSYSVTAAASLQHGGNNATDGGLTKLGTGTLILSGVNTYTGATYINAGTLLLSNTGSLASNAVYVVSAGSGPGTSSFTGSQATFAKALASGTAYNISTTINGDLGTTAAITGANVADETLSMSWRTRTADEAAVSATGLISDVVYLGAASESFTLSMTYDTSLYNATTGYDAASIYLAYWDGMEWEMLASTINDNVVTAEISSSMAATATAYAVVPEPSALSLLAAAAMGLIAYAWRRRQL